MKAQREARAGLLFAAPWLIGFTVFLAVPLLKSFYYSFCDYSVLTPPVFIGFQNYIDLFKDPDFWTSLYNTLFFAVVAIPLGTTVAIGLALLLNTKVKGQTLYRTFFFLPSLVPTVPMAVLWLWLFNGKSGLVNEFLKKAGGEWFFTQVLGAKEMPNWLGDPAFAKFVLIVMSVWGVGNAMVIYLAGLQEVPVQLYEAANLDGATPWQKTRNVTLPLLSPVILFNVIMGIIGSMQYFTQVYVMFPGGAPAKSTYLYAVYMYDKAFRDLQMGYASAMGWILFLIILALTLFTIKYSEKRVYYEA